MDRMSRLRPARGLTLLELLVALGVLALLAGLAVPGFQALQQNVLIRLEAGRLLQAALLARSEALARGQPVTLCPAADSEGQRSACQGDYSQGWLVYANPGLDAQPSDSTQLLQSWPPLGGLHIRNRAGNAAVAAAITWHPDGSARRNLTWMVCSRSRPDLLSWSLVLNQVGRPRLARGWGNCDVPV